MATTPNMNLDLPEVGTTAGPEYATKNNDAFSTVDSHDHTAGKGAPVPTAGININDDLSFNSNNINELRALRLDNQTAEPTDPTDIRVVYAKNGELFYRDASSNEVQITNSGSVAGATGTIAGLVSPASAVFSAVGGTFVVSKDSNKPAKTEMSDLIIKEFDNATANGITIKSPAALGSTYTLTLPTAQAADATFEVVGVDSTGQLKYGSVTGTANQVSVAKSVSGYTLSTPQDIHVAATPTFAGLTSTGTGDASNPPIALNNTSNTGIYGTSAAIRFTVGGNLRTTIGDSTLALNDQYLSAVNTTNNVAAGLFRQNNVGYEILDLRDESNSTVARVWRDGGISAGSGSSGDRIKWERFSGTVNNLGAGNTNTLTITGTVLGSVGRYEVSTGVWGSVGIPGTSVPVKFTSDAATNTVKIYNDGTSGFNHDYEAVVYYY